MKFLHNDGGRAANGYKGDVGDCVCRAIAIATGQKYDKVYKTLFELGETYSKTSRTRVAKRMATAKSGSRWHASPRNGVHPKVYHGYLLSLGWNWVPTMKFGEGCKVHMRETELPMSGTIIVRLSKHLSTVVDGVINDTYDPSRNGWRCVYGYYTKENI